MTEHAWLRADKLTKVYKGKVENVEVFRDLDFSVEQGEFAAIVGESGAGKSTLLHLLGGLSSCLAGPALRGFSSALLMKGGVLSNRDANPATILSI